MTSSDRTELAEGQIESFHDRVGLQLVQSHDGAGLRIGVVVGHFNGGISARLLEGCLEALFACGVDKADITVTWVPGAFEVPLAAQRFASAGKVDAVITLGAVIRGDTPHFEYVAGECARGISDVQLSCQIPVVFGVLTVNTEEQALIRSEADKTNKGYEAGLTAIWMARLFDHPDFTS
ncbi:MAG: 6,7-dimethyl-8-ribityllumazine synthase [Actinobacteria bacterium]|nr:6,7-dimethyl-8-ribityllumazine synthase [Actinomycetota bacterium]